MELVRYKLQKILRSILRSQHHLLPEIMLNWSKIVGKQFSDVTYPIKIISTKEGGSKTSTLLVGINDSSSSLLFSFHHDLIIERIRIYLGFKAIDKILTKLHPIDHPYSKD
ncbi:MAG: DciA family protein [Rickettsiaceae bacterium]